MSQKNARKWFMPNFETISSPRKKIKLEENEFRNIKTSTTINSDLKLNKNTTNINTSGTKENWLEKFSPKTVSDLAVHSKKVKEVQVWIEYAFQENNKVKTPMLLITGPTGAGKTATVKVLCNELKISISEWVTPADVEYIVENDTYNTNYKISPKQSDTFMEFLFQASRYSSLFEDESKKLILIEDYPNAFLRDSSVFFEILGMYSNVGKLPLVFICTDTKGKGLNISKNLFSQEIKELYNICNISFNPISNTAMRTTIKKITSLIETNNDTYNRLSQETVESIVNSSLGDIRNAVLNLHFSSLKSSLPLQLSCKSIRKSKKTTKGDKLSNLGCDETISLLHSVGRVLNPKRIHEGSKWTFSYCPEDIANQFLSQPSTFIGFLHENYLHHFSHIEHVTLAIENLSLTDCIMQEWREKDTSDMLGLSLAVRSLMLCNEKPISAWNPVRGPKYVKIEYPKLVLSQDDEVNKPSRKIAAEDYVTYFKDILNL